MAGSRPHTSSGPPSREVHGTGRHGRRTGLGGRPSTSSGIAGQKSNSQTVPIVVTSPFASAYSVPPFADFMPARRRSAKKGMNANAVDNAQFSTADRTILEELKLGVAARESQFNMKANKKHHPYPAKEAPYPLNYERPVIDHDVWETMFVKQLSASHTFHVFDSPPTKVLDLGCGSGYWILECAKQWRNCEFVGLDLVPLHPDLSLLRSPDLVTRIKWVQANCLDGLPFPNDEFDFVHIKRIAHGIPEDKWDFLLEEISRVMKPGAAIEVVEEDLFFPGRVLDPPQPPSTSPRSPFTAPLPVRHQHNGSYYDTNDQSCLPHRGHASSSASTTTTLTPSIYSPSHPTMIASMSTLPVSLHDTDTVSSLDSSDQLSSANPRLESGVLLNPRDHSLLEHIYTEMHSARFINLSPLSLLAHSLPLYFESVRSHAPIMFMFPPPDLAHIKQQLSHSIGDTNHSDPELRSTHFAKSGSVTVIGGRDILHQAQQYVILDESAVAPGTKTARQKATPTTISSQPPTRTNSVDTQTKIRFPSIPSLVSSGSLFSEDRSTSTYSHAVGVDMNIASWFNTLPNQRLKFDLQSLNLHLSMRITEILACSEAMWEWVCEYQDALHTHRGQTHKSNPQSRPSTDAGRFTSELVGLSRSEFDVLLTQFEFDMHDCINMNSRITSAFHTPIPTFARTSDRKAFDDTCEKWDKYQMRQRARRMPPRLVGVRSKKGSDLSAGESLDPSADDLEAAGPSRQQRQRLSRTFRVFCAWKAS